MTALLFVDVKDKNPGELDIEFEGGESLSGRCVVLTLDVIDADTMERQEVDLVIHQSSGPRLLVNLLTDDQWDAVCDA